MKTILYFQSASSASGRAELEGAYRFARSARWQLQVVRYGGQGQGRLVLDDNVSRRGLAKLVSFWKADGAIVESGTTPGALGPDDFGKLPVVFLDRIDSARALCVYSDSKAIAEVAARELLTIDCASYAYFPWREDLSWSRGRGEEFARILQLNGVTCHVVKGRDWSGDTVEKSEIIKWMSATPKPLGVFAANDFVAERVIALAKLAKIRMPSDLAVVGVDNDIGICEHASPTLTSIAPDHEYAGFVAGELLAERIAHPRARLASRTFGVSAIIHRQSTNTFRRSDNRVNDALGLIRRLSCDGLGAADVIRSMGISRRLAELRFREATGKTILEQIVAVRLERAQQLLRHTADSVADIARQSGWTSSESLRRTFQAAFGVSPSCWRRRNNGVPSSAKRAKG